jgi:predicted GIY-YIG superfamily endonuclease
VKAWKHDPGPTAVYRFFDRLGRLLYVGISRHPDRRIDQHMGRDGRGHAYWRGEVASVTVDWFPTRGEARQEEVRALNGERPIHNRIGNPHRRPWTQWDEPEYWRPGEIRHWGPLLESAARAVV